MNMTQKDVAPFVHMIKEKYKNYTIPKDVIDNFLVDCMEQIDENIKFNQLSFHQKLSTYVIEELENGNFEVIDSYMNNVTKPGNNFRSCMKKLNKVSSLFSFIDYSPELDFLTGLLKYYPDLGDNISVIVNHYQKEDGTVELNQEEELFSTLIIQCYCLENNINISEKEVSIEYLDEFMEQEYMLDKDFQYINSTMYYIKNLNEPLLKPEEEIELAIKMKNGDLEARKKLIEANLRLVVNIASRYQNKGLTLLDLIQEGNLGLIKAVDMLDVNKISRRFSTYSNWWIKWSIVKAIKEQSRNVRFPIHKVDDIAKYDRTFSKLTNALGRIPTDEEMVSELGWSINKYNIIKEINQEEVSLNKKVDPYGDDDTEFGESLSSPYDVEDSVMTSSLIPTVKTILKNVNVSDRDIEIFFERVGAYDGVVKTLEELASRYHLTHEGVRQIETKVTRKIRCSNGVYGLADYTDDKEEAIDSIKFYREKYLEDKKNSNKKLIKQNQKRKIS